MRNQYWDTWKGLAIVAVVAIHAFGSALAFPDGSVNQMFGVIVRQFINFPVALFVLLSGMFALQGRPGVSYASAVRSRATRLLIPYLIWAAVYVAAKAAVGKLIVADIPEMVATGTVISVGYYVIVMLQIAILSPILERLSTPALMVGIPISIVCSCAFTYGMRVGAGGSMWSQFPYSALPFFLWLPFYLAGLLVARDAARLTAGRLRLLLGVALVGAGASVLEAFLWLPESMGLAISQLKISSMITSLSVCALMIGLARTWTTTVGWRRMLAWLGARSFYFYLSHMIVLGVAQKALRSIPGLEAIQPAFVALAVITTIAVCALGGHLLERLVKGNKTILRWIGIA